MDDRGEVGQGSGVDGLVQCTQILRGRRGNFSLIFRKKRVFVFDPGRLTARGAQEKIRLSVVAVPQLRRDG